MPAAVYDFPSIAARLRKDGFYDPPPRPQVCDPVSSNPPCTYCGSYNNEPSINHAHQFFCTSCCNWY